MMQLSHKVHGHVLLTPDQNAITLRHCQTHGIFITLCVLLNKMHFKSLVNLQQKEVKSERVRFRLLTYQFDND